MSDTSSCNQEDKNTLQRYSSEDLCGSELEALKQELHETKMRLAAQAQKMAELSLKASEHRLRMLFERMPQGVIYQDAFGQITAVNPAVERILGMIPDQKTGKAVLGGQYRLFNEDGSVLPSDEYPSIVALRTGRPVRDRLLRFCSTGKKDFKWLMVSSEPEFREGEDLPYQVFTTVTDITGIKKIEDELISQKSYTESLLAAIPDQMFILNTEGVLLDFKPGRKEELALPPEEFLNRKIRDVMPEHISRLFMDGIRQVMDGRSTDPVQYEIMVNGRIRNREGKMSPLGDDKVIVMISDVSWRVETDRALRDSEECLRSLVNSQTSYVLRTDPQGRLTYWNPKYEKDFSRFHPAGILQGSILEHSISRHHHQLFNDSVRQCIAEPGSIVKVELDTPAEDGNTITTLWELLCFTEEHGSLSGVQYVGIDITDRKKAERRLIESEEKYRSLIDSSDAFIAMIDRDGRYLYLNEIAAAPFGRRSDEMIGLTVHDLFKPGNADMMMAAVAEVISCNSGTTRESTVDVAGESLWFRTSLQPVRNESGAPFAVMVHSSNITDMKSAEIRLRQSEENYRNLFYNSPDGYLIIRDGRFTDCNRVAEEMIGCSRSMIVGKSPGELSPEFQPCGRRSDEYAASVMRYACQRGEHSFEWTHRRIDGSDFLVQVKLLVLDHGQDNLLLTTWRDITAQRQSELQIRKLSQVVEQSPVYIVITDPDGKIEYANTSLLEKTGYSYDEVIGQNPRILKSGFHSREFYKELWDTVLSGRDWKGQICNRTKSGELYWERASISPILNESGRVINLVAVKQDFTEQMKIEKSIAESEARLNDAQEMAEMGSWEFDIRTGDVKWSRNYYRLMGLDPSRQPMRLEELKSYIHPDDRELFEAELLNISESRSAGAVDYRLLIQGGEIKCIQAHMVPRFEGDELVSVRGISLDVTERVRKEEEIRKLTLAIEQSPVVFVITDLDGTVTYASPAFSKLTGYSSDEIKGRDVRILASEETDRTLYDELLSTVQSGRLWHGEWLGRKQSGDCFPERAAFYPILDRRGKIVSCLCIMEDLTVQKKAQDDKIARQAAEQASQAKSVFLANMSHEIRTPLNAIIGFSQILKRDESLSERHLEHVQTILRSGEHLLALINDVLDLSKIEAGHVCINPVEFSLDRLLNSLEPMFSVRLRERELQFLLERSCGLPDYIVADEGKLKQVLINLVANAIKFTRRGRVCVRFRTEAYSDCQSECSAESEARLRLIVEVEDTGLGIAEADMGRIFDSFHQTEAGRAAGGTGLGLTISRTLIEMMGGHISVESQAGRGSIFRFHIPVMQVSEMDHYHDSLPVSNVSGLAPGAGPFRILAVDDNIDNLSLVKAILEPLGFQVRTAMDGAEGLTAFEEWSPHAVLMDIRMPVMDGCEAIKRIKATPKGLSTLVIALTASAFESDRGRILAIGADDHLRKPFEFQALLAKLARLPGLQYIYEDSAAGAGASYDLPPIPKREDVMMLPEPVIASMREAMEMGDMGQLRDLISRTPEILPSLAAGLLMLVRQYDYDSLSALLGDKGVADNGNRK